MCVCVCAVCELSLSMSLRITIDGTTIQQGCIGVVDTGTTLIEGPQDKISELTQAIGALEGREWV